MKRVFWTLVVAMAGLVLARVVDPVTAQQMVGTTLAAGLTGVDGGSPVRDNGTKRVPVLT